MVCRQVQEHLLCRPTHQNRQRRKANLHKDAPCSPKAAQRPHHRPYKPQRPRQQKSKPPHRYTRSEHPQQAIHKAAKFPLKIQRCYLAQTPKEMECPDMLQRHTQKRRIFPR